MEDLPFEIKGIGILCICHHSVFARCDGGHFHCSVFIHHLCETITAFGNMWSSDMGMGLELQVEGIFLAVQTGSIGDLVTH